MRELLKATIIGLLSFTTAAQAQHMDSVAPDALYDSTLVSKLEYGLVCPSGNSTKMPAPGTHLGFITQRDQSQRIEHTTQIVPLSEGIGFGVDVHLPDGLELRDAEITVTHPPYPGTDVTTESWTSSLLPQASNLNFFLFEFPFEMVAGEWGIQASHDGRLVYSVSFNVVDPSRIPHLSRYCDGALMS
ncbi:DUF3859 domain-containing protein [Litoreibacter arenae]|uniref:DUF3859 domain-containing protein n=1 Tax=Litoreibacter arenae DSM 19593 TaxID=1123360 RepID=S9QAA1_9RHOB|nr:DUF3859 domain-containing protein [Litoreibacter arenae]EPX76937.1 hypothetical protein thalar_02656 [Litoreibacter arenae DSM 19593]